MPNKSSGSRSGSVTMSNIDFNCLISQCHSVLSSSAITAALYSFVCFRRLGESFKQWTYPLKVQWAKKQRLLQDSLATFNPLMYISYILHYLLSPTRRTGYTVLNETWFKDALLLDTICWLQIGWYLSTFKSKIWALPSKVTAAKTVLEKGDQATSPTSQLRSNMKRESL